MDYNEFGERIKAKYPEYKDMDNLELSRRIVAKYPEYKEQVSFDLPNSDIKPNSKEYFLQKNRENLQKRKEWEQEHPIISRMQKDFSPLYRIQSKAMESIDKYGTDITPKELLTEGTKAISQGLIPAANIGTSVATGGIGGASKAFLPTILRGAGQGAIQGTVAETLDELGDNGLSTNVLKRGVEGATGGAVGGGVTAGGLRGLDITKQGIKKLIENPNFQDNVTKGLEFLTSVPQEYSDRALKAILNGEKFFDGKFNAKTAYRPIEELLGLAKSKLPSKNDFTNAYKNIGNKIRSKINNELKPESWYDEQYQNIGNEINKKLQMQIKPESYYDKQFNAIGQKAYNSINNLQKNAGETLNNVLSEMDNTPIDIVPLRNAVNNVINSFAKGGDINPALIRSGKEINLVQDILSKEKLKPVDIHNLKEILYDIADFDTTGGIKNNAAKGVADQLNNYLRRLSPKYAEANDIYSNIMNLHKQVGGINNNTIATKLRDYKSSGQLRSGADQALMNLDALLPFEDRFINNVENLQGERIVQDFLQNNIKQGTLNNISKFDKLPIQEQALLKQLAPDEIEQFKKISLQQGIETDMLKNMPESILNNVSKFENAPFAVQNQLEQFAPDEINLYKKILENQQNQDELLKIVGNRGYERNPRLLSNRTDIQFENAINDLQNRSGINFMEKLKDIRAREALEKIAPGQGGGSGGEQGFFNNVLRPTLAALPKTAIAALLGNTFGGPLGASGSLAMVSPKIMAKGTIKNLGNIYNAINKPIPDSIRRLLTPFAVRGSVPMLYGGISND